MTQKHVAPEMLLPPGTLSYPHLFVPKKVDEKSEPKYSMRVIWSPEEKGLLEPCKQECAALLLKEYGPTWLEAVKQNQLHWPFKKIAGLLVGPGMPEGGEFINFSSSADEKPHLFDRYKAPGSDKAAIITDPARFYAGCRVVVLTRPYLFKKDVKKGVSVGMQGVQWWADGPRIDGRSNPIEKFAAEDAPTASIATAASGTAGDSEALASMLGAGVNALP